jgi:hypothetical protein
VSPHKTGMVSVHHSLRKPPDHHSAKNNKQK